MFDPYEKWLGIPRDQRPVNYFQLLDLDPDETDSDAIRAAAKRQARRVTPHKEGPHAQACIRLLKEISLAQSTLVTPAQRKAYRAQLVEVVDEAEERPANGSASGTGARGKKKGSAKSAPKAARTGHLWLWLALGGSVAALVLVGGVVAFWLTRSKKADAPAPSDPVAVAKQAAPAAAPAKPPVAEKPPAPKKVEAPAPKAPAPPTPPLSRPPARRVKPPFAKLAVPDQAAQDRAEKTIKETYQADYAKRKLLDDHLALAIKLLQPGREDRKNPAAWYVLLREARDAAVRAERPRLAIEAVDEIDKWFLIDAFGMKLALLTAMTQAGGEEVARAAARTALFQVEEAVDADNYEVALRLADAAEAAARKGKNNKQITAVESSRNEVKEAQQAYKAVVAAREKLRQTPDDPVANRTVGRHLCFTQGRWDEGLPILAKGGPAGEAALARQDLKPPANLEAQIAAGDGWWTQSESEAGREKMHLRERAFAWYELAQPVAPAGEKDRLADRMGEVMRESSSRIPRLLPGSFFGRAPEDRILLLREGGGTARSEEAVERGLDWLAMHQTGSGKWANDAFHVTGKCTCSEQGQKFDVAGTAFGLLPFLGAGHTPRRGRHSRTVLRGLAYLISQQKPEGKFSDNMYENALATIAMCEAYGMSRDQRYLVPAQAAVTYIVRAQHPEGSWGYSPGAKGDTSITGWQFSALKAGHYAGLNVPSSPFAQAGAFLDKVADPGGQGYGYNSPGAARATTSTGLLCREYLGWWPSHPGLVKGLAPLLAPQNFVHKDKPAIYFLFYATQVMHHAGGEAWETWNPKVRDLLIDMQDAGKDPGREHQKGSWSPRGDEYAVQGGRLMFTSLALLTLEVYYYHIPLNDYGPAVLRN